MFIFSIITIGDRKMSENIWEENQASDNCISNLGDVLGKNKKMREAN
jgi:hypothetical protein